MGSSQNQGNKNVAVVIFACYLDAKVALDESNARSPQDNLTLIARQTQLCVDYLGLTAHGQFDPQKIDLDLISRELFL